MITKWEYKKTGDDSEKNLNKLGAEGWEAFATSGGSYGLHAIFFKRQLP